jgi:hypothetical protein
VEPTKRKEMKVENLEKGIRRSKGIRDAYLRNGVAKI